MGKCYRCNGFGYIALPTNWYKINNRWQCVSRTICKECGGKGVVKIEEQQKAGDEK